MENIYIPKLARINKITVENEIGDLKTFEISFLGDKDFDDFKYIPGQFVEISSFGIGEAPFGVASSPTEKNIIKISVKKVGKVTTHLHDLDEGDLLGVRGPLGNGFPLDRMKGKDIVIVSGGFAFTTLRALIIYILNPENRDKFKDLTVVYGAREPGELMYKEELESWEEREDINLVLTVDKGDERWKKRVGLVPNILKEVAPKSVNAISVVCGPPIMIKFTFPVLRELGFTPDTIITSLEMRMKCGIGKCGRCNIGSKFVCLDGPVFTLAQLKELSKEY